MFSCKLLLHKEEKRPVCPFSGCYSIQTRLLNIILSAAKTKRSNSICFLQRLKPGDPILSFRQCERHTFSMRPDREVRYCITVQQYQKGDNSYKTTGIVSQKFGLGDKTSRSEVCRRTLQLQFNQKLYISWNATSRFLGGR